MAEGEYVGFLATAASDPDKFVAGRRDQVRSALPGITHSAADRRSRRARRRWCDVLHRTGIPGPRLAKLLMQHVLDAARSHGAGTSCARVGRGAAAVRELGFAQTNEMRFHRKALTRAHFPLAPPLQTAGLALNITPADMLYVAARRTSEGRSAGIVSALASVLARSCTSRLVARGGGAAQRGAGGVHRHSAWRRGIPLYLGVRALLARQTTTSTSLAPAPLGAIFRQGVITNVTQSEGRAVLSAFLRSSWIRRAAIRRCRWSRRSAVRRHGTLVNLGAPWEQSCGRAAQRADKGGDVPSAAHGRTVVALAVRLRARADAHTTARGLTQRRRRPMTHRGNVRAFPSR